VGQARAVSEGTVRADIPGAARSDAHYVRLLEHAHNMYARRMVEDQNRTVRVQLLLTPEEAQLIDNWRFAQRAQSRNEAIRRLVELGLKAFGEGHVT
jgi:hypothetical protein